MPPLPHPIGTAAITENLLKRRWSATILRYLDAGISDATEILRREAKLSVEVLNERLRTMHRYELIHRQPRPGSDRTIEYRLTVRGQHLLHMLDYIDQLDRDLNLKNQRALPPPPTPPEPLHPDAAPRADRRDSFRP
jgi:DNA-binding HxlR family transcriptional regulator